MRLIDADALIQKIESPYTEYPIMIHIRRAIKEFIDDAPTIEIVRCNDCRWYKDFDGCFFSTAEVEEDGFCSYGERSEP